MYDMYDVVCVCHIYHHPFLCSMLCISRQHVLEMLESCSERCKWLENITEVSTPGGSETSHIQWLWISGLAKASRLYHNHSCSNNKHKQTLQIYLAARTAMRSNLLKVCHAMR